MRKMTVNKITKEILDNYNKLKEMELSNGEKIRRNRIRTKNDSNSN